MRCFRQHAFASATAPQICCSRGESVPLLLLCTVCAAAIRRQQVHQTVHSTLRMLAGPQGCAFMMNRRRFQLPQSIARSAAVMFGRAAMRSLSPHAPVDPPCVCSAHHAESIPALTRSALHARPDSRLRSTRRDVAHRPRTATCTHAAALAQMDSSVDSTRGRTECSCSTGMLRGARRSGAIRALGRRSALDEQEGGERQEAKYIWQQRIPKKACR